MALRQLQEGDALVEEFEDSDYFDDRICSYPCEYCGETDEDEDDD